MPSLFSLIRRARAATSGRQIKNPVRYVLLLQIDEPMAREVVRKKYQAGVMLVRMPETMDEFRDVFEQFDPLLDALVQDGFVEERDGLYRHTEKGRTAAEKIQQRIEAGVTKISSGLPTTVLSVVVNVVLAVVCLIAGVLSNSMGMISSGIDNMTGVITSLAAYFGIKYRAEFYANAVIVVLIFVVGLVVGYESLGRLLHPVTVDAGLLPVAVAAVTGIVCYALSRYQHIIGKMAGKLSLIILSVDNVNSALISLAVLAGILFAGFGVLFVDPLVSLAVAVLMLKSAFDLGRETLKIADGEEPDLSQFIIGPEKRIHDRMLERFRFWTLVSLREPRTRAELEELFSIESLGGPYQYAAANLRIDLDYGRHCEAILGDLQSGGMICEAGDRYLITGRGIITIKQQLKA